MSNLIILLLTLGSFNLSAATLAVIDSGVDINHELLAGKIWVNEKEIPNNNRDEDKNGYQDDVNGWNFAENSSLVLDPKYLGTFSDDPATFFAIQGRKFLGTMTAADEAWVKEKREDQEFMVEMQKFGNFVHGTHVAGIAAGDNEFAKILAVKLIPTEVKPFFERISKLKSAGPREKLLKAGLRMLAVQQMELMGDIAYYISDHGAKVANGSFGTGFPQAKMISGIGYKIIFWKTADEENQTKYGKYLLEQMVEAGKNFVAKAPNTLFVFAAGNDGMDNDMYPASPASVRAENVLTVAATYGNKYIAPFSNYGITKVDVAAPGMLIHSAIPGNDYLEVSGTSQAAPYVANICDQVISINPKLSVGEMKQVVMGTVDQKEFLKGKVSTEGIVNKARAVYAAKMSLTNSVDQAITLAKNKIADEKEYGHDLGKGPLKSIKPMPLTSLFK